MGVLPVTETGITRPLHLSNKYYLQKKPVATRSKYNITNESKYMSNKNDHPQYQKCAYNSTYLLFAQLEKLHQLGAKQINAHLT